MTEGIRYQKVLIIPMELAKTNVTIIRNAYTTHSERRTKQTRNYVDTAGLMLTLEPAARGEGHQTRYRIETSEGRAWDRPQSRKGQLVRDEVIGKLMEVTTSASVVLFAFCFWCTRWQARKWILVIWLESMQNYPRTIHERQSEQTGIKISWLNIELRNC